MVVAYVRLYASLSHNAQPTSRVYALLLPSAEDATWEELSVLRSTLGGFGVYPRHCPKAIWNDATTTPILLPYLGVETVVQDALSRRLFIAVLRGNFELVTVGEVAAAGDGQAYEACRHFAQPPQNEAHSPLPPETLLLQVCASQRGDTSMAYYLLADEVRELLHLVGPHAHLFDLLCAHAKHEHAERQLATHLASFQLETEGYVLVNAHPAFSDPMSITGSTPLLQPTSLTACVLLLTRVLRLARRSD